jgi:hypothetical protein
MSQNDYLEVLAFDNNPFMETVKTQLQPFIKTAKTEAKMGNQSGGRQPGEFK